MSDLLSKCASSIVGIMLLVVMAGMIDVPNNPVKPMMQVAQDLLNSWIRR